MPGIAGFVVVDAPSPMVMPGIAAGDEVVESLLDLLIENHPSTARTARIARAISAVRLVIG
jgi:hypothetical protein